MKLSMASSKPPPSTVKGNAASQSIASSLKLDIYINRVIINYLGEKLDLFPKLVFSNKHLRSFPSKFKV